MSQLLKSMFGFKKPQLYPAIETDDIYPLHFLDQLSTTRGVILSGTLRFNSVLDPVKLGDGLTRLITKHGDWRKLGGRLRQRTDGSLEIHVPREFDDEHRPAIGFSNTAFEIPIEEHHIGCQFTPAQASAATRESVNPFQPSLHPGPTTFDYFTAIDKGPTTIEDYLCSDAPILRLHITSFTNATIVVLICPHVVAGALGLKEVLSAWSKSLASLSPDASEKDQVPELLGASKDVLDGIATPHDAKVPEFALAKRKIKGFGLIKFFARMLWTVFRRPKVDSRALILPQQFVSRLREACLRELEDTVTQGESIFLSEGDVLLAWCTRFVAQMRSQGHGNQRPGLIFQPLDITSRLDAPWYATNDSDTNGTKQRKGVYFQNLIAAIYTDIDALTFVKKPLGILANTIRSSIKLLATDGQIRAQLQTFRSMGHTKLAPLYGDSSARLINFSNWAKFGLFGAVDFPPAVTTSPNGDEGEDRKGKPVYMHFDSLEESPFRRDCFVITGKDLGGNSWITAFLYPEDWDQLERYIDETCRRI